ncbi:MAG: PAS domain-containing protein [Octadecabacter sp.]
MLDITTTRDAEHDDGRACLNALEGYWNDLFRAQRVPQRCDVDPAQIDHALPSAFLVQRVAPGVARLRVSGQRVNACLGMDAQGMPLSTFFLPSARAELSRALEQMFTTPALVELPIVSPRGIGRPLLRGRLLLLPLADDYGDVTRALGAMWVGGDLGRGPRRFEFGNGAQRCQPLDQRTKLAAVSACSAPRKRPDTTRRPALQLVVNNDA